ncbi:MAG: alanine--tRNA ligase [Dethiobacter sp.]|nr:alanine--tRNA ligase [Dethiobacter sp.]MCL5982344.1 alanine--tRNA ligase [Bacillota bacterium]
MLSKEIRAVFLDYFQRQGHLVLPSFSLIPNNDPSLLLIGAGMAPLKPYFTGEKTPPLPRLATCQKCVRTPDIDKVGRTSRHATFFEMLGNFSFGDYFKEEAITWAWELVTAGYKLPEDKLYVSVYEEDDEAYGIWHKKIGLPPDRIFRLGKADNFWEIGEGPCGPCSEIYYDLGAKRGCGRPNCEVGCDCDRFLEIWNLVFTQFNRTAEGHYEPLAQKNIDTGAGLERLAVVLQGVNNLFEIDTVSPLLHHFAAVTGVPYNKEETKDVSLRIITEHLRGTSFLIADGILPSNEGRGYVLRRLLRRAVRHGKLLGQNSPFLHRAVEIVSDQYGETYPELIRSREFVAKVVQIEEERFHETLEQGTKILNELIWQLGKRGVLSGEAAFKLYDTYGFPVELTREILAENQLVLDMENFQAAMAAQRERARGARSATTAAREEHWQEIRQLTTGFVGYDQLQAEAEILAILRHGEKVGTATAGDEVEVLLGQTPFYGEKGGQVGDTGNIVTAGGVVEVLETVMTPQEQIVHRGRVSHGAISEGELAEASVHSPRRSAVCRNHTATHLLHSALRELLGEHVRQAGSLVTAERLRFDFTHLSALSPEQLSEVERMVTEKIWENIPVHSFTASLEEAQESGAIALFEEKYGHDVRMIRLGGFSTELCGGTHVATTGEVGLFKIISEAGIGAGLRRIEALTGAGAYSFLNGRTQLLESAAAQLKAQPEQLPDRLESLLGDYKELQRENQRLQLKLAGMEVDGLLDSISRERGVPVISARVSAGNMETLREMADRLKHKLPSGVIVLGAAAEGKVLLVAAVTPDLVEAGYHAGRLVGEVAKLTGGGGGGRPDMAQAGGKNAAELSGALAKVSQLLQEQNSGTR